MGVQDANGMPVIGEAIRELVSSLEAANGQFAVAR